MKNEKKKDWELEGKKTFKAYHILKEGVQGLHCEVNELQDTKLVLRCIGANNEIQRRVAPVNDLCVLVLHEGTLCLPASQALANNLTLHHHTLFHCNVVVVFGHPRLALAVHQQEKSQHFSQSFSQETKWEIQGHACCFCAAANNLVSNNGRRGRREEKSQGMGVVKEARGVKPFRPPKNKRERKNFSCSFHFPSPHFIFLLCEMS